MENLALIDSFSEFKDDKLIDRVTLMAILEDVFRNALKKNTVQTIISYIPDKEIWKFGEKSYCCGRRFRF
jgi:hypothetical protein